MQRDKFDDIWDRIIIPLSKRILDRHSLPDLDFDKKRSSKQRIYNEYDRTNKQLHRVMCSDGKTDRHKVAASLAKAILVVRPFTSVYLSLQNKTIDISIRNAKFKRKELLPNEFLAIFTSMTVVANFILSSMKSDDRKRSRFTNGLIFPSCEHGQYDSHLAGAFFVSMNGGSTFDCFMYSHLLFLLEQLTDETMKV